MIKNRCKNCGVSMKESGNHTCKSSWNKGKKGLQIAWNKGKNISKEHKDNLSKAKKGVKQPNITGLKNGMFGKKSWNSGLTGIKGYNKGRKFHKEVRDKISGSNHYNWKGGYNSINLTIRKCYEYRQWVQDIFKRDNYTCQECGIIGGRLNAHHIKQFALVVKENHIKTLQEALDCYELWNFENGQTLCIPCHKKTDSYLKMIIN